MAVPKGTRIPTPIQTVWWVLRPISFLRYMRSRFGDAFAVRFYGIGTVTMFSAPDDVRTIFTGDPNVLQAGKANFVLAPLVGEQSILLLDGERHLRQRKLLLPPFHGERMRAYVDEIAEVADAAIDQWREGEEVITRDVTQSVTLDIILRIVFGIRDEARAARFRERMVVIEPNTIYRVIAMAPLARILGRTVSRRVEAFKKSLDHFDEMIYDEIALRRADPDSAGYDDILSLLLEARDEDGEGLSDLELRDELVTLVVAGHETTATSLAWTIELLLRNPLVMERARAEANLGEPSEYIDAVIKESLRLRPIIPMVVRVLAEPFTVGGYELPEGTVASPNIYLAHHNPDTYPDPYEFRPERFIGVQPESSSWLPFGGGIRRCIGASFAQIEMRVILQTLLRRVELEAVRSSPERVVRRAITLTPKHGVPVIPHKIQPATTAPRSDLGRAGLAS
ncbi:MAG: cytochrome P450 [Thermoleophilaceae bacterium]|nr:cytochrome P450 [Thermoleophilaceae bacterium]